MDSTLTDQSLRRHLPAARRVMLVLLTLVLTLAVLPLAEVAAQDDVAPEFVGVFDDDFNVTSDRFIHRQRVQIEDSGTAAGSMRKITLWLRNLDGSCERDLRVRVTDPAGETTITKPFSGCTQRRTLLTTTLEVPAAGSGQWSIAYRALNGASYRVPAVRIDAVGPPLQSDGDDSLFDVGPIGDGLVLLGGEGPQVDGPQDPANPSIPPTANNSDCPSGGVSPVQLELKAFLSGSFDASSNLMHDNLRQRNVLPDVDPYFESATVAPTVFATTGPDAIVDWVVVELRHRPSGLGSATVPTHWAVQVPALIQRDGDIVDVDGVSPVSALATESGTYTPVVWHRSHGPVTFADLTHTENMTYSATATQQMMAGDANGDFDINGDDKAVWQPANGQFNIYHRADFNMDATVDGADKGIWFNANGNFFFQSGTAQCVPTPTVSAPEFHGALTGTYAVSRGSLGYEVPLEVVGGMSLVHGGGSHPVADGWAVAAGSQITRCPQTIPVDGISRGPQYTATDRFCLDGALLVPLIEQLVDNTNPVFTVAGRPELRVERTDWTPIGGQEDRRNNLGPASWTVFDADGGRSFYAERAHPQSAPGAGPDTALPVHAYGISSAVDVHGNDVDYIYAPAATAGGHLKLARIRWGGNTATAASDTGMVEFIYQDRTVPVEGFLAGGYIFEGKSLKELHSYVRTNGTWTKDIVTEFVISEDTDDDSVQLDQVRTTNRLGETKKPLIFTYETDVAAGGTDAAGNAVLGLGVPREVATDMSANFSVNPNAGGVEPLARRFTPLLLDFDGDGASELVWSGQRGLTYFPYTGDALTGRFDDHAVAKIGDSPTQIPFQSGLLAEHQSVNTGPPKLVIANLVDAVAQSAGLANFPTWLILKLALFIDSLLYDPPTLADVGIREFDSVAAGDVDGDGAQEFIAVEPSASGPVSELVVYNWEEVTRQTHGGPVQVHEFVRHIAGSIGAAEVQGVEDVNRDGLPDLLWTPAPDFLGNATGPSGGDLAQVSTSVNLNVYDPSTPGFSGMFGNLAQADAVVDTPVGARRADVTGDGVPDLVIPNLASTPFDTGGAQFWVRRGLGDIVLDSQTSDMYGPLENLIAVDSWVTSIGETWTRLMSEGRVTYSLNDTNADGINDLVLEVVGIETLTDPRSHFWLGTSDRVSYLNTSVDLAVFRLNGSTDQTADATNTADFGAIDTWMRFVSDREHNERPGKPLLTVRNDMFARNFFDLNGDGYKDLLVDAVSPEGLDVGVVLDSIYDGRTLAVRSGDFFPDRAAGTQDIFGGHGGDVKIVDRDGDGTASYFSFMTNGDVYETPIGKGPTHGALATADTYTETTTFRRGVHRADGSAIGPDCYDDSILTVAAPTPSFPVYDAAFPQVLICGVETERKVISTDVRGDGNMKLEPARDVAYTYAGHRQHAAHGDLGFAEIHADDPLTKTKVTTRFNQNYPFIGTPLESTTSINNVLAARTVVEPTALREVVHSTAPSSRPLHEMKMSVVDRVVEEHYSLDTPGQLEVSYETRTLPKLNDLGRPYFDEHGYFHGSMQTTVRDGSSQVLSTSTLTTEHSHRLTGRFLGLTERVENVSTMAGQLSVTDVLTFAYDTNGQLRTTTSAPGTSDEHIREMTYDTRGMLATVTDTGRDSDGTLLPARTVSYTFDPTGRYIASVSNPLGHTTSTAVDFALNDFGGFTATHTDFNSNSYTTHYDAWHQVARVTRPVSESIDTVVESRVVEVNPATLGGSDLPPIPSDVVGRIALVGEATQRYVDSDGAEVGSLPIALSIADRVGRPLVNVLRDQDGRFTYAGQAEFDTLDRVHRSSTQWKAPVGSWAVAVPGNAEQQWTLPTGYDGFDRPVTVPDLGGRVTSLTYAGLTTTIAGPDGTTTSTVLDELGNVTSITDAIGNSVSYDYDNPRGNLSTVTDAEGNVISSVYDAQGRLQSVSDPSLGDRTFTWDTFGRQRTITDALGHTVTTSYDLVGRPLRTDYPEITYQNGDVQPARTETRTYDQAANGVGHPSLTEVVEDGVTIHRIGYEYDSLARLKAASSQISNATTPVVTTSATVRDQFGRQEFVKAAGGLWTRNLFDPTTGQVRAVDLVGVSQTPTPPTNVTPRRLFTLGDRHEDGRVIDDQLLGSVERRINYETGDLRRPIAITATIGDPAAGTGSLLQELRYGWEADTDLLTFNAARRLFTPSATFPATPPTLPAPLASYTADGYTYDDLGRLETLETSASATFNTASGTLTFPPGSTERSFSYSASGAPLTGDHDLDGDLTYGYDGTTGGPYAIATLARDLNGAVSTTSYTYDANGAMQRKRGSNNAVQTVQWNALHKARKINATDPSGGEIAHTDLLYGVGGVRIAEVDYLSDTNGTRTTVFDGDLVATTNGAGVTSHQWRIGVPGGHVQVTRADAAVAMNNPLDPLQVELVLTDHLDSPNVAFDASSGTINSLFRYDALGERRDPIAGTDSPSRTAPNADHPFGYTGQRSLGGTAVDGVGGELIDYGRGTRIMDPQARVFLSPDTVVPSLYNSQDFNRYSYVRSNPGNFTDPSGNVLKRAEPPILNILPALNLLNDFAELSFRIDGVARFVMADPPVRGLDTLRNPVLTGPNTGTSDGCGSCPSPSGTGGLAEAITPGPTFQQMIQNQRTPAQPLDLEDFFQNRASYACRNSWNVLKTIDAGIASYQASGKYTGGLEHRRQQVATQVQRCLTTGPSGRLLWDLSSATPPTDRGTFFGAVLDNPRAGGRTVIKSNPATKGPVQAASTPPEVGTGSTTSPKMLDGPKQKDDVEMIDPFGPRRRSGVGGGGDDFKESLLGYRDEDSENIPQAVRALLEDEGQQDEMTCASSSMAWLESQRGTCIVGQSELAWRGKLLDDMGIESNIPLDDLVQFLKNEGFAAERTDLAMDDAIDGEGAVGVAIVSNADYRHAVGVYYLDGHLYAVDPIYGLQRIDGNKVFRDNLAYFIN